MPILGLCKAELQLNCKWVVLPMLGLRKAVSIGSNGATEKPSDALPEMVFNLKEKDFLVRMTAYLPLGQRSAMVSDAA